MKIIRSSNMTNNRFSTPRSICPCCGETKQFQIIHNKFTGRDQFIGVDYISTRTECKGIIRTKLICTDVFMCHTCGAKWESDPYEKGY